MLGGFVKARGLLLLSAESGQQEEKTTVAILAAIRMKARPGKRRELVQTVLALAAETRKQRGCTGWYFSQDVEDENAFILTLEWETQTELDKHLRSEAFEVLLGGATLLCDPPEIGICTPSAKAEEDWGRS